MILEGDCRLMLHALEDQSIHTCVTSPPYFGLRDYGVDGQLGQEPSPEEFVSALVEVFRKVRRVLRDDGTVWLNMGDSYAAQRGRTQEKQLLGIPWRVALALQADGWYLRQDIIWHKPNPMPESVKDRCTKAHEYIFLLSKGPKYYFDHEAIKEPALQPRGIPKKVAQHKQAVLGQNRGGTLGSNQGAETRNRRSVWTVTTKPFKGAHFATFPPDLIEPCVLAGCPEGGTVLDPFFGAGTTGLVAKRLGREYVGIEMNPEYIKIAEERIASVCH